MNKFAPSFLKKLDAWLLLNYPRIWATQAHYFVWILLCGTLISAIVAFIPSITMETIEQLNGYYASSLLNFSIQGIIAFVLTIFWLTQFRAKLRVFNYKEGLLSLLFCVGIVMSIFFFCTTYSIVLNERKANFIDKKEVEKDALLSHLLTQIGQNDNTILRTVEDVTVQGYALTKKEIETIFLQKKYFSTLDNITLGGYISPNIDSICQGLNDEQIQAKQAEMDEEYRIFHFKAVENCQTVPDSIKKMYFDLSKSKSEVPVFYNQFSQVQLPKISPTTAALMNKYASKTQYDENLTVVGSNAYLASSMTQTYFALQNSSWLGRLLGRDYFSFSIQTDGIERTTTLNSVSVLDITQEQVNLYQKDMDNFKERNRGWENVKMLCILLFFPFMLLCGIIHFGIRDILIGVLCFIVVYLLNFLVFALFNFSLDHVPVIPVQFFVVQVLVFYFYWQKNVKQRRLVQLLLPFSVFVAFVGIVVSVDYLHNNWFKEYDWQEIDLFIGAYLLYTLLVFPFVLALYHRLEFLPKQK